MRGDSKPGQTGRGAARRVAYRGLLVAAALAALAAAAGAVAAEPDVRITSPAEGATVPLNWTLVGVEATDFVLDPAAIGQAPAAGRGHYHVFLDGVYLYYSADDAALVKDIGAGPHTVRVALYNNDHTPIDPPVWDEVNITVLGGRSALSITAPVGGAVVWGDSVPVAVAVTDFTLNPGDVGAAPVQAEGHWHLFVDGVYVRYVLEPATVLTGLAPGEHIVRAVLYNNDHTPVAVPVSDEVTVHVAAIPTVTVVSPAPGAELTSGDVTVTVEVVDLVLDAGALGAMPQAGHGNFEVRLDGAFFVVGTEPVFNVTGLEEGEHTISVTLHNNDHTPIPGAVSANVTLRVVSPPGFLPGVGAAGAAVGLVAALLVTGWRRRPAG